MILTGVRYVVATGALVASVRMSVIAAPPLPDGEAFLEVSGDHAVFSDESAWHIVDGVLTEI